MGAIQRGNMKNYLKNLADSIMDEHNVFVELTLVWIAGMLTLLVVLSILGIFFGGS